MSYDVYYCHLWSAYVLETYSSFRQVSALFRLHSQRHSQYGWIFQFLIAKPRCRLAPDDESLLIVVSLALQWLWPAVVVDFFLLLHLLHFVVVIVVIAIMFCYCHKEQKMVRYCIFLLVLGAYIYTICMCARTCKFVYIHTYIHINGCTYS